MTTEQKVKLTKIAVQLGLYAIVGFIAIPFAVAAIKGWLLLITLMCLIGGTLTVAPALAMAAGNWRLKLIKDQAARNPVETMQNILALKEQALKEAAQSLELLRTKRATYLSKLASFKRRFPDQIDYFETAGQRLTALLRDQEEKYLDAKDAIKKYSDEVDKTQAIWEMGKAAAEATKGLKFTEDDWLTKIKSETSIESAEEQLESSFSALDQSLLESKDREPSGKPLPPMARAEFQKALT